MTVVAGPFLRATVVSDEKTVDVVLPTDQAVSLLMPTLQQLLGRPDAGGSEVGYDLVTLEGLAVDQQGDLASSDLRDGVHLRIVSLRESPPVPVVYDLVDVVEAVEPRGMWNAVTRRWVIAGLAAVLIALSTTVWSLEVPDESSLVLAGVGLVALVGSAIAGWRRDHALAWSGWVLGASMAITALLLADFNPEVAFPVAALLVAVLILSSGWAARRLRSTLSALIVLALLCLTAAITWQLTQDVLLTCAVVAVVCAVVIGLLPRIALASTGAFTIDARVTRGVELARSPVEGAVSNAHWSLAGAVGVASVGFALTSYVTLLRSDLQIWPVALVVTVLLGWGVRIRHFPLAAQRAAMLLAAITTLVGLGRAIIITHPDLWSLVVAVLYVVALAAVVLLLMRGTELLGAVARRWANRVEMLSVVATLPLLVGVFGVYGDLLDTF